MEDGKMETKDTAKVAEKVTEKAIEAMKGQFICDSCIGRNFAELLSGLTNKERGRIIRHYIAFLVDSGERIDVDTSNFYGIKFRNVKIRPDKPKKCAVCKNFFLDELEDTARKILDRVKGAEFDTFLIGTVVSDGLLHAEETAWHRIGVEWCEPIKSEINRELGKLVEKLAQKKYKEKNPDVMAVVDLNTGRVNLQISSLYISGGYKKLVRGIPQTKWLCVKCGGKGCEACEGLGKLYKTSVQEQIEKPLIKAAKAKKSKFHGAGREDVDARCLAYRPFVIELLRPLKRKVDLEKMRGLINKSRKVQVSRLKFAGKDDVTRIKSYSSDKTYLAVVAFENDIDKRKLGLVRKLAGQTISQKTPSRVAHRRADKYRKRKIKAVGARQTGRRELELRIRAEAGTYIKEMIDGDGGRTELNIAGILGNKVKSIKLDVIKIHTEL